MWERLIRETTPKPGIDDMPAIVILHTVRALCGRYAGAAFTEALFRRERLKPGYAEALWDAIMAGKRSNLALLASVGVRIDARYLPPDRFEMRAAQKNFAEIRRGFDKLPYYGR
jgi:hypothetical protein